MILPVASVDQNCNVIERTESRARKRKIILNNYCKIRYKPMLLKSHKIIDEIVEHFSELAAQQTVNMTPSKRNDEKRICHKLQKTQEILA